MNRRPCHRTRTFATAAGLALALTLTLILPAAPAVAAGMATDLVRYELTSDSAIAAPSGSASGPQVVFSVLPAGSIVPPTNADGSQGTPLTILNSSSGFDQDQLVVALKNMPGVNGAAPSQLFGLSFVGDGLKSVADGGKLDFALSVDAALGAPNLTTDTPGLHLGPIPVPVPVATPAPTTSTTATNEATGSSGSTSPVVTTTAPPVDVPVTSSVPEPASVGLWAVLAAAGAWRLREGRRRPR